VTFDIAAYAWGVQVKVPYTVEKVVDRQVPYPGVCTCVDVCVGVGGRNAFVSFYLYFGDVGAFWDGKVLRLRCLWCSQWRRLCSAR